MPGGWSKQHDVRKLADARAGFEFDIPLADLPGLPDELPRGGRSVQVGAQFDREQGWPVVDLRVQARLQLVCQRCLQPLEWPVDAHSRIVLVEDQAVQGVPEELEVFLAAGGRISIAALAGEEVLLALPAVALHDEGGHCGAPSDEVNEVVLPANEPAAPEVEGTTRPFADLAALLKRGRE